MKNDQLFSQTANGRAPRMVFSTQGARHALDKSHQPSPF